MNALHLSIIAQYTQMEEAAADLLLAARDEDWDSFDRAAKKVQRIASRLEHCSETLEWDHHEIKQLKRTAIKRILAQDAQIRDLTEPWVLKLELMMNTRTNKQLQSHRANQA